MNKWQKDVLDFHKKFDCHIEKEPTIPPKHVCNLREDLIEEELDELSEAFEERNIVQVAKEAVDVLYTTIGALVSCGIDIEPIWDEVHRTNMSKVSGGVREDGKILKPVGWEPPNLLELLEKQGAKFLDDEEEI